MFTKHLLISAAAFGLMAGALTPEVSAQNLSAVRIANGFSAPLWVGSPAGDFERLFVVEQSTARIKIIKDGTTLGTPFLDIGSIVGSGGERGLLGLAFHPDFMTNGRFFVNYTNNNGNTVVQEYYAAPGSDVASGGATQTIMTQNQPYSNHNGGCINFGPETDGSMLYVGMGDGGSGGDPQGHGQNINSKLGAILRYDVDLPAPFIPASNPYVGVAGDDAIYSIGIRNPWRFSFDMGNGDLYIGDVGQNAREEINWNANGTALGGNFGWKCMEGGNCYSTAGACVCSDPAFTEPVHDYSHGLGCSVTGGYVYRGSAIPSLDGTYFFGDYCSSRIWSFKMVGGVATDFVERTAELEPAGSPTINSITSFGQDAAGEIYIVDPGGGEIYKIVPDCGFSNYCVSNANSAFPPGSSIQGLGSSSVSANDMSLLASLAVPGQFGLFFYGASQTDVPFGDGHLCVGAGGVGIFRLGPPIMIGSFGDVIRPVDNSAPPMSGGAGMVAAGSTWNFQFWYRDPMGPGGSGFNTSDAVSVLFCP